MRKMRIFQRDGYVSLDFVTGVSEVYSLLPVDQKVKEGFISFGEIGVGDKKKRLVYEQPEQKEINALQYELQLFVNSVLKQRKTCCNRERWIKSIKSCKNNYR